MYPIRTTQGISLPLIALIAAISASYYRNRRWLGIARKT